MTTQCSNWQAWLDTMPPKPDQLHVVGDVLVANPGVDAILTMREPQGINASILILDLRTSQRPGMWPQVVTCAQARFDRILPPAAHYLAIDIQLDGEQIALIDEIKVTS